MQIKNLKIRLGNLSKKSFPIKIFDEKIIDFLDNLSKEIMLKPLSKIYPDLFSFGFWCRKENIKKIKNKYNFEDLIIGRGTVFHICPSNVPMNFAYSLVFGLLAGNDNIIRLPSRNFVQSEMLIKIIDSILKKKKFFQITKKICLVKYDKSDDISQSLSKLANARLIWGGDKTINKFKKFETNPRCVDLNFSNRYSISVISSSKLRKISKKNLTQIANNFYNDAYTMDQLGCSSPQAIFFVGKKNPSIIKFWKALEAIVNKKYKDDFSVTNKKFELISNNIVKNNLNLKLTYNNFNLIRLKIKNLETDIDNFQNGFGVFFEINIKNLNKLSKFVSNKYQTLTYLGFSKSEIKKFVSANNLLGIDRIVPIGRAFDMGNIWDGYDIIQSLSRKIAE